MKKIIYLMFTLIIALFMFSGRVHAVNMHVECNFNCDSVDCGTRSSKISDADKFFILTNSKGDIRYSAYNDYWVYLLENSYPVGDGTYGCWLNKDYGFGAWVWEDTCNSDNAYSDRTSKDILLKGMCPVCMCEAPDETNKIMLKDKIWEREIAPIGNGNFIKKESIGRTEYVVYKFIDYNNEEKIFIEGYLGDEAGLGKAGAYAFVGPFLAGWGLKEGVIVHQINMLSQYGGDYWKVHEIDGTRLLFENMDIKGEDGKLVNLCKDLSPEECREQHGYEVIFSSNNFENIMPVLLEWIEDAEQNDDVSSEIFSVIENNRLNDTSDQLNKKLSEGKSFTFSNDYSISDFVTDLEKGYNALFNAYNVGFTYIDYTIEGGMTSAEDSVITKVFNDVLKSIKLNDISYVDSDAFRLNEDGLFNAIRRNIKDSLEEILYGDDVPKVNLLNVVDYLDDYTLKYYTTVSYLSSNPLMFGLDSELFDRVETLRTSFEQLVESEDLNIYPVVDCRGLLGQDLIDKINSYLDIIKIIIPIILIGYGIIDFTKAIFGGEDNMKKAQKSLFKRIAISVLIFLTPTIVNLILNLANKVWPIITPNSCGLFE